MRSIPVNKKYSISECGTKIYNNETKRHITIWSQRIKGKETGYLYASLLSGPGSGWYGIRPFPVHRLVAMAYNPNPNRLPEVHHKDGDRSNNHKDNLEWVTAEYNRSHHRKPYPTGKDHWNYGKKVSAVTRRKMSRAKVGKKHPKFKGYYILPDGSKHASSYLAAKASGLNYRTIHRKCKNPNIKDYSFEPI